MHVAGVYMGYLDDVKQAQKTGDMQGFSHYFTLVACYSLLTLDAVSAGLPGDTVYSFTATSWTEMRAAGSSKQANCILNKTPLSHIVM